MLILDEKGLSGIVKRMLDVIFFGGIAIVLGLPFIVDWYLGRLRYTTGEMYWFMLPFLYVTGILALIVVFEMRKIFRTLNRRNPFMMDNVKSLQV